MSESEVMKLGRWKTPSMFLRYDIVDEKDLNVSVAKSRPRRQRRRAEDGPVGQPPGPSVRTARPCNIVRVASTFCANHVQVLG